MSFRECLASNNLARGCLAPFARSAFFGVTNSLRSGSCGREAKSPPFTVLSLLACLLATPVLLVPASPKAAPLSTVYLPATPNAASQIIPVGVSIGFYFNNGHGYYNGYRGYSYRRPGWHPYRGFWFPPMAFGAYGPRSYAPPPPPARYRLPSRHYAYCSNRYRSYRASDNTFQPYHGPRRACRSPYWP